MNSAQVIVMTLCISMDLTSSSYLNGPEPMLPPPDGRITPPIIRKPPEPDDLKQLPLPVIREQTPEERFSDSIFWGPGYEELQRNLPVRQDAYASDFQIPSAMKKLFGIVLKFKDLCQDDRVKMFKELGEIFKENIRAEDAEKTRLKEKLIDFLVKAASVVAVEESKQ